MKKGQRKEKKKKKVTRLNKGTIKPQRKLKDCHRQYNRRNTPPKYVLEYR